MNFKILTCIGLLLTTLSCRNHTAGMADNARMPDISTTIRPMTLNPFDEINVSAGILVEYSVTPDKPSLTIEASAQKIDKVKVEVEKEVLCIGFQDEQAINLAEHETVVVRVKGPALQSIDLSSSARLCLTNGMTCPKGLNIDLNSSAQLNWKNKLQVEHFVNADLSSSASMKGDTLQTAQATLEASSASTTDIQQLSASHKVDLNTSSSAKVTIKQVETNYLSAQASSSSNIYMYAGTLQYLIADASSSASLEWNGTAHEASLKASSSGKIDCRKASIHNVLSEMESGGLVYHPQK